jgi:hypothetical protein
MRVNFQNHNSLNLILYIRHTQSYSKNQFIDIYRNILS